MTEKLTKYKIILEYKITKTKIIIEQSFYWVIFSSQVSIKMKEKQVIERRK